MTGIPNAASVALIADDRVLLIQRARAPYSGLWTLPGGRLEAGEDAETAAVREVHEEVGLRCFGLRPVQTMDLLDGRFVLQVLATKTFEGEVVASDEIRDFRWVRLGEVAGFSTTDRLGDVLGRAFAVVDGT